MFRSINVGLKNKCEACHHIEGMPQKKFGDFKKLCEETLFKSDKIIYRSNIYYKVLIYIFEYI